MGMVCCLLLVSKSAYSSCEINVALDDERLLRIINNKLEMSIKLRSCVKALPAKRGDYIIKQV